ncbi:hypothetical protein L9F63_014281, partial [Diploptera punctata]
SHSIDLVEGVLFCYLTTCVFIWFHTTGDSTIPPSYHLVIRRHTTKQLHFNILCFYLSTTPPSGGIFTYAGVSAINQTASRHSQHLQILKNSNCPIQSRSSHIHFSFKFIFHNFLE